MLYRSRKGLSSTIAAAFFVTAIVLAFNFMLIGSISIDSTSTRISQSNLLLRDKLGESITFLSAQIGSNQLNVTAYNTGGVVLNIVRLWVTNKSAPSGWHKGFNVGYWIQPGASLKGIGNSTGYYSTSNVYLLTLVTARGNLFQTTYSTSNTLVSTVQGFGWITVDWSSYLFTYSTNDGPDSSFQPAWCIPLLSATTYQFRAKLINHYNQSVTLLSWTYLKLQSNGGSDQPFFIMRSTSSAQSPSPYSDSNPISLLANPADQQTGGQPVELRFLASTARGDDQNALSQGDYSVLIVAFYKLPTSTGVQTVGQTIAYEGTEVLSSSC